MVKMDIVMKQFKYIYCLASALLILGGCVREEAAFQGNERTINRITVHMEDGPSTRAHLENGNEIAWAEGDVIGVFSDSQDVVQYTYAGKDNDGKAVFMGDDVTGSTFYAFYPYDDSVYDPSDRMNLHFDLPEPGTDPAVKLPMVAKSSGTEFGFRQTCGILHCTFKGARDILGFAMTGNLEEPINGRGSVNLSDETPVFSLDKNVTDSLQIFYNEMHLGEGETFDVYFVLPPMTFGKGFTMHPIIKSHILWDNGEKSWAYMYKKTTKPVSIQRAIMKNYVIDFDSEEEEIDVEREALIALYEALGGDNWKNNTNWCTDEPLGEWYGIGVTDATELGHVASINLEYNGLEGSIPSDIGVFSHLTNLNLARNSIKGSIPEELYECTHLETLDLSGDQLVYGEGTGPGLEGSLSAKIGNLTALVELNLYDNYLSGAIPPEIGNLTSLKNLNLGLNSFTSLPGTIGSLTDLVTLDVSANSLSGELPASIGDLTQLISLKLNQNKLSGSLPSEIGDLSSIAYLNVNDNLFSGNIPDELYSCRNLTYLNLRENDFTGSISPSIKNLQKVKDIYLNSNQLEGNIPAEVLSIPTLEILCTKDNKLSGIIPAAFENTTLWDKCWGNIITGNSFDISQARPKCPDFTWKLEDGSTYSSAEFAKNELTAILTTATWCPISPYIISGTDIYRTYDSFKDKGLDLINWWAELNYDADMNFAPATSLLDRYGIDWKICIYNHESHSGNTIDDVPNYPKDCEFTYSPGLTVMDKEGRVVYSHLVSGFHNFRSFVEEWFGEEVTDPDLYESTDYSRDGNVVTIQTATQGKGIDLVFMGDGYSDRLIADGTYDTQMRLGAEAIFSEEPYKSFRDFFNVYYVEAVSKNEGFIGNVETAFGSSIPEEGGNPIPGNSDTALSYAQKAIGDHDINECTIAVLMNSEAYGGICNMMMDATVGEDYGSGSSVSWVPKCSMGSNDFKMVLTHEMGGHGFAKLMDEYYPEGGGAINDASIDQLAFEHTKGWSRNVDSTSDLETILWSRFIVDSRYSTEKIGAYEGGLAAYRFGVWRPTETSIMKSEDTGFNAPSREAIWYRIHKLAYGADWEYNFEDFVAYDAINLQKSSPNAKTNEATRRNYVERERPQLAKPIIIIKGQTE